MRNTRRYGGYVVHFGMVLVFIGISGQAFNQDKQMDMSPGSVMTIGPYTLHLQNFDSDQQPNYSSERATIDVDRGGRSVMMLYPQRRFYPSNQESGTMVAISSTLKEDLYVVYAGTQSGYQSARHSRLPESAGEVDLVRWRRRCPGNDSGVAAESPGRAGDVRRDGRRYRPVPGAAARPRVDFRESAASDEDND